MAVFYGVTNLDGHTAPAVGAIQQRETEAAVGTEDEPGANGESKFFVPHKYSRSEISITGVGDAELSLVTVGTITAGTAKVISAKQQEFAGALPKFERRAVLLANLPA